MRADEVAWAVPRVPHGSASSVAVPQPLAPRDAGIVRRIFALQARGDLSAAVRAMADLEDRLLVGTLLADQYLGRHHHSTADELSDWLARYRDLPDAPAIHTLLLTRLPKDASLPPAPEIRLLAKSVDPDPAPEDLEALRTKLARQPGLDRNVLERAQRGNAASALRLIATTRNLSPAYAAQLRAEVAQVLFTQNEDVDALRVAQTAQRGIAAPDQTSLGFYIGGLAAWRLGRAELARDLFEKGAMAARTTAHVRAASAFWASRVSRTLHDTPAMLKFLHIAADEQLTLHGLLARRVLRMDSDILPNGELLSQADVDAIAATPCGRRAYALLQIGQPDRAEAELHGLWPAVQGNPVLERSLLMVAAASGLTDYAAQIAAVMQSRDGRHHDTPRLPVPRLRPAGGFSIDPSLVYAVTRIESNFDADAVSPAGARGLMQIMPSTAQYITGDLYFAPDRLHEPGSNLNIGQRYIAYLARQDGIDNDLMRLLASYNAGPGNFARWAADIRDQGDPLLFIEAIPAAETRSFVPHILMYSWIYAARLHLPADSLESLSAGEFPRFTPRGTEHRITQLVSAPD